MAYSKGELSEFHRKALKVAVAAYDPHHNVRNGNSVLAGILEVAVSLDLMSTTTLSASHGVEEKLAQCWINGYEIPPVKLRRAIKAELIAALK